MRKIWVKGDPDEGVLGDCPFCHRALLTLELKGLDYEKGYIKFSDKPDWLFEVNPEGTVPVIKDGDEWIADSAKIIDHLNEVSPEPDLGVSSVEGVAEKLLPSFAGFFMAKGEDAGPAEAALLEQLEQLESYLQTTGDPFLNGAAMGAFDCMLLPRLHHMQVALGEFKKWQIPEKFSRVRAYVATAKQTDAFKNTQYGDDLIIAGWGAKLE